MKSKRTRALEITKEVKERVWERDGEHCILCGTPYAQPNAHYIPRSHSGLGIETNIVTLCPVCHYRYDNTEDRKQIGVFIEAYLRGKYPDWDKEKQYYRRSYE